MVKEKRKHTGKKKGESPDNKSQLPSCCSDQDRSSDRCVNVADDGDPKLLLDRWVSIENAEASLTNARVTPTLPK